MLYIEGLLSIPRFSISEAKLNTDGKMDLTIDMLGPDYYEYLEDDKSEDFRKWYKANSWIPDLRPKTRSDDKYQIFPIAVWRNKEVSEYFVHLSADERQKLIDILARKSIHIHLRRIWSTNNGENLTDYSINLLKYLVSLDNEQREKQLEIIPDSIDGTAAGIFWTLCPYIYISLKELQVDTTDAFDLIFLWAELRQPDANWEFDAIYPGVPVEYMLEQTHYLSANSESNSHVLAYSIAQFITNEFMKLKG